MSNLVAHAQAELEMAGLFGDKDFYGGMTGKAVLELIKVFSDQGHSGMSAPMVVSLFSQLANFKPINPITGADDEWTEVGGDTYQNNRLSSVFKKGKDGKPYYLDAIVWRCEDGSAFTGTVGDITSRQFIKLPFLPKTFYVDVDSNRGIKNQAQLNEALEFYQEG